MLSRALVLAAATLASCVARSDVAPAYAPGRPPFLAWLERDPTHVTVVVVPLTTLRGAIALDVTDLDPAAQASHAAHAARASLPARGGRRTFAAAAGAHVRVDATWRDPHDAAAARAILEDPSPGMTAPVFAPIVRFRAGHDGAAPMSVDKAIRIR